MIGRLMRTSAVALFLLAATIWGSTWLAITFQLGVVPPEASVCYRFAIAAVVLALWCAVTRRPLRFDLRTHGWLAAQGALLFGLNYIAVYKAEQYVASGLVAVVFSTIVFTSLVASRVAFGIAITRRAIAGAMLGLAGVALLFLPQLDAATSAGFGVGIAYAFAATLLATGGNLVAMRLQRRHLAILPTTAWGMGYGAALAAIACMLAGVSFTFDTRPGYLLSLAYLAIVGSVVAFGAYLTLLKRVGPGPSSYVGVATPVLAMMLSTIAEHYRWTAVAVLGVVLAVAGNMLVLRRPAASAATTRGAGAPR